MDFWDLTSATWVAELGLPWSVEYMTLRFRDVCVHLLAARVLAVSWEERQEMTERKRDIATRRRGD